MPVEQLPRTIIPDPAQRRRVEELSGQRVSACFQCEKCTNGCPVTFAFDLAPHRLMRLLHLGQVGEVLRSDTIWVCASCETCSTRCPNDIDITRVMDTLRQLSRSEGLEPSQKNVPLFHRAFLSSIRRHGRVHEPEMAVEFALRSGGPRGLLNQAATGLAMFTRGKIALLPARLKGLRQVKAIFKKAGVRG